MHGTGASSVSAPAVRANMRLYNAISAADRVLLPGIDHRVGLLSPVAACYNKGCYEHDFRHGFSPWS